MRVVAAVSDPASAAWDDGAVKVAADGEGWASMPPAWALPVTVAGDLVLLRAAARAQVIWPQPQEDGPDHAHEDRA
jgi:hypothetical protein